MSQLHFDDNNPLNAYLVKEGLIERLIGSDKKVTWIWGETGSGKTVLGSMIFARLAGHCVWLQPPEHDAEAGVILQQCKTLLQNRAEETPLHFFLDNAHRLQAGLAELCHWVAESADGHVRLFVISQNSISADYSALVVREAVEEVPPSLLHFTLNDSIALCKQHGKVVDEELIRIHQTYNGLPLAIASSLLTSKDHKVALPEESFLRAAQWEENQGNTLPALALYLKAKRLDYFAQLFLGNARHWFASGHRDKIGDVLSLISEAEKDQYPWCWVWESLLVLPTQPDSARQLVEHAYALFKQDNDITGRYLSMSHAVLTYLVKLSDFGDIRRLLNELAQFDSDEHYALLDRHAQASVSYIIFFCMFIVMPEHEHLSRWEQRTLSVLVSETEIVPKLKMQVLLQKAYLYRGDNYKIHPLETLKEIGNDKPIEPYDIINFNLARIQEGWCLGRFDEIKELYRQSMAVTAANNMQANIAHTSLQVIIALLLNSELDDAKQEIYRLLNTVPREMTALLHHLYAVEAWRQVLQKEHSQAILTAQQCNSISRESGCIAYIGFSYLVEAYTLALAEQRDKARDKLRELKQHPHLDGYTIFFFHIDLLDAYLAFAYGHIPQARLFAGRALEFAARKNLLYFIWSVPEVLALSVSLALETGCQVDFCNKIIEQLRLPAPPHAKSERSWHWPVKIRTLGGFDSNIEALNKSGKSRRIQLSILYLAIAYGDNGVPMEFLCDSLWPDEDIASARHKLDNTLYRLRQILGKQSLVIVNNKVKLDNTVTWVDAVYLVDLIRQCKKALQNGADRERLKTNVLEMMDIYRGEFLDGVLESHHELFNHQVYVSNQLVTVLTSARHFFAKHDDEEAVNTIQRHLEGLTQPVEG